MGQYSTVKKNKITLFTGKLMDLEVMLSKVSRAIISYVKTRIKGNMKTT